MCVAAAVMQYLPLDSGSFGDGIDIRYEAHIHASKLTPDVYLGCIATQVPLADTCRCLPRCGKTCTYGPCVELSQPAGCGGRGRTSEVASVRDLHGGELGGLHRRDVARRLGGHGRSEQHSEGNNDGPHLERVVLHTMWSTSGTARQECC